MKKRLISILLILAVILSFASCKKTPPDDTDDQEQQGTGETPGEDKGEIPGGNTGEVTADVWETLQSLSEKKYSSVKLSIKTVTGNIELESDYTLMDSEVTYSVERLNLLPTDGNLGDASSSYKTTYTGVATVKDGKVETIAGEAVSIPSYDELKGSFNFREKNFEGVKDENGRFEANVLSPTDFLGSSVDMRDMRITVTYNNNSLQKLEITYVLKDSTVTTVYEFSL
ncbi:MAG: hypothetical protein IJW53_03060 [Clostridia bacterium]|nr:hypothetical protein [Clostridia bacterium]